MESKLTPVYNTDQEIGFRWEGIIFTFYEAITLPPEIYLDPILVWLAPHSTEIRESIAHVMVDVDSKTLHVFFKGEVQKLNFLTMPSGHKIEMFEFFPYGAKGKDSKWESYERDDWTEDRPVSWGESKLQWRNDLDRKDIWG
jgi:hypothetical protein